MKHYQILLGEVIDSVLKNILNIKEEFEKLNQKIQDIEYENYDNITLKSIKKYITYGLSEYYETPSDELFDDFSKNI